MCGHVVIGPRAPRADDKQGHSLQRTSVTAQKKTEVDLEQRMREVNTYSCSCSGLRSCRQDSNRCNHWSTNYSWGRSPRSHKGCCCRGCKLQRDKIYKCYKNSFGFIGLIQLFVFYPFQCSKLTSPCYFPTGSSLHPKIRVSFYPGTSLCLSLVHSMKPSSDTRYTEVQGFTKLHVLAPVTKIHKQTLWTSTIKANK